MFHKLEKDFLERRYHGSQGSRYMNGLNNASTNIHIMHNEYSQMFDAVLDQDNLRNQASIDNYQHPDSRHRTHMPIHASVGGNLSHLREGVSFIVSIMYSFFI